MSEVSKKSHVKNGFACLLKARRTCPLFLLSIAAVVGILVGDLTPNLIPEWLSWTLGISGLVATIALFGKKCPVIGSFVLFLTIALLFSAFHVQKLDHLDSFVLLPNLNRGQTIRVTDARATVVSEPRFTGSGQRRFGRAVLKIDGFRLAGRDWKCHHRFPAVFEIMPEELKYGDRIEVSGRFEPLREATSPGAFHEKKFHFRSNDAVGKFYVEAGNRVDFSGENRGFRVVHWAHRTRDHLESALMHGIGHHPIETRSVITAMVLGMREDAPEEVEDLFRLSGTMHIFAVSGLHVGIIAAFAWFMLPLFGISRRTASLIIIPVVLFYAVVTGLRPSAIRAAIMISVVALGFCLRRPARILNSLGFAALIILILNTQQVFQPGFQLSFAVLLAIAWLANPI
ncbi:MAG: ComEC/Rec2 family competence protein, partial [Verrucomicrobiales bacterium]|nr:ComEC/Rec2 family competence protein [Verrucomicrobiales bacterium]